MKIEGGLTKTNNSKLIRSHKNLSLMQLADHCLEIVKQIPHAKIQIIHYEISHLTERREREKKEIEKNKKKRNRIERKDKEQKERKKKKR
jgi:hypothetical protein